MNRIALFCALLGLVFTGLFWADLQGHFNVARDPVAYVDAAQGTVRRLAKGQLSWDRVQQGTLFGSGDTVSTGEGARTRLVFYAGGELELEPGAMVSLNGDFEEMQLSFVSGTGRMRVQKDAQKKISITQEPVLAADKGSVAGRARTVAVAPRVQVAVVEEKIEIKVPPTQKIDDDARPLTALAKNAALIEAGSVAPGVAGSGAAKGATAGAPSLASGSSLAGAPGLSQSSLSPSRALASLEEEMPVRGIQEKSIRSPDQTLAASTQGKGGLISMQSLPAVPEVKFPANDAVIDLGVSRLARLEWEPLGPAVGEAQSVSAYEVTVRPADGKGQEKLFKTSAPYLSLAQISRGKYLWSVRAVSSEGKRGPASKSRWLEVKVPASISKPKMLPVRVE